MPEPKKTRFIAVAHTKIVGKHVDKGDILELDVNDARDAKLIAELHVSDRIAVATPELIKQIKEELSLEQATIDEHRQARTGARIIAPKQGA